MAHERYHNIVATTVVVVRGVQRLMNIPNEVDKVLESFESLTFWDTPIR
jgi:hypothetical protein